ncbi:MAG: hypothetical protein PHO63_03675, partial [Bacilli bacterium]|nr:hypothetical protein [Bacilli bacterium]
MKKILLILLLCCAIQEVNASNTYYSKYSDFSEYKEEPVISSDTVLVETKNVYQWYKQEKILGDYYIEGENNLDFPLIDREDYIYTDWTEWSSNIPWYYPYRTVDTKDVMMYQQILKIRYLMLDPRSHDLLIPEIEVYIDNIKIDYDTICLQCNSSTGEGYDLKKTSVLIIDLKDYYMINQFKLVLSLFDNSNQANTFSFGVARDINNDSKVYTYNDFTFIGKPDFHYEISFDNLTLFEPEY